MPLQLESWEQQRTRWPKTGRHILAQFDDESIVVYQAYRPAIADFAVSRGRFGGEFSLSRMSWIKPNFLWMMYRSGWGTKPDQEVVLAIRLRRAAFDGILSQAVPSTYNSTQFTCPEDWQRAVAQSNVRLQFDPDHDPHGRLLDRRAIQLGLRGDVLARYAREWIMNIEDLRELVREQRELVLAGRLDRLLTPREDVYPVHGDVRVRQRLADWR